MENVMDAAGAFFKDDMVERLSSCTNESPSALRKAIQALVPASVAGLATHASTEATAGELLGTLHSGNYPQVNAVNVGSLCSDDESVSDVARTSRGIVQRVFAGKLDRVLETVSAESGIRPSSVSTLLGISVPAVLGVLGRLSASRNLDARGLSQLLTDQGSKAASVLPAPLANAVGAGGAGAGADLTARTLGEGVLGETERRAAEDERPEAIFSGARRRDEHPERAQHERRRALLLPILFLIALVVVFFLLRGRRVERPDVHLGSVHGTALLASGEARINPDASS